MRDEQGSLPLKKPWPQTAWLTLTALVVVSGVLGFLVLPRY